MEGVDEVGPCVTRGGGILNFVTSHFYCFNLIISRCKIAKYVMSHKVGGISEMTGRGKNHEIRVT